MMLEISIKFKKLIINDQPNINYLFDNLLLCFYFMENKINKI